MIGTTARTLALALLLAGPAAAEQERDRDMTRITVTVGDTVLDARLEDSPPARDFASMLPLDLVLEDYHGTEKVADLGRQLDNRGAPRAYAPKAGDITQYRPWSNLAIFYRDFSSSAGLLKLGRFDGPIDALLGDGPLRVRIALAD
ncbi:cyclophilin-like fold protein [Poseidonocella sp. HB161398]|uniref:cyclophilin-like fold protein n=1 Tax=Poseidonocella sp. HB161398 TaxID=2320855 RepID=UPI001F0E3AE1|nr:cyclophilin-like fold protein [Poseidonocella sp. HB161398]